MSEELAVIIRSTMDTVGAEEHGDRGESVRSVLVVGITVTRTAHGVVFPAPCRSAVPVRAELLMMHFTLALPPPMNIGTMA